MSEEGERICPLCAEEMDLTDQQLKPCKCGYEICVWCWHHIIEMAKKQDTEGRCPACRTPYDKDRIVGMSSNCKSLVAETNGERKLRPQKAKAKSSTDARKHLSSVRVIQRNLVYIIGLPLSVSDENIIERREFFGQYGKVLKVSRTRPPQGTPQGPNSSNSCNVYITYAKEEEAVRCIQSVHNFVLEGKQLRACFGTTKYCHAWLRNMPCCNPDCFYLHDVGSREDSFTKDEIISAYTRSRVPQITISNSQKRLGNVLPPPVDDFNNGAKVSAKTASKNSSNNSESSLTSSPSNSNLPRSAALPSAASWGSKLSHSSYSTPCSKVASKEKNESSLIPLTSTSSNQLSLPKDVVEKCDPFGKNATRSMYGMTNHGRSSKACANSDSRPTSNLPSDLEYGSHSSAWNDDDASPPSSKVTQCSLAVINPDRGSWSLERSESCVWQKATSASSSEVAFNESILSSWDEDDTDDTFTLPKTIEGKHAMLINDTNILAEFPKSSFIMNHENDRSHSTDRTTEPTTNSNIVENLSVHSLDEKGIVISEDGADFSYGFREFDVLTTAIGSELIKHAMPKTENMQMLSVEATSLNIRSAIEIHGKGTHKDESSSSSRGPLYPGLQALNHDVQSDRLVSLHLKERLNVVTDAHPSSETSDWMRNQWKQKSNGNAAAYSSETSAVTVDDNKDAVPCVARQTTHFPYSTLSINAEDHSRNICEGDYHNPLLPRDALSRNIRSMNASSSFAPDTGYQHQDVYHSEFDLIPKFVSMPSAKKVADIRESNIISKILSMDVNPWDISSSTDFSKIICETDKQPDMLRLSSLLKGQTNNPSRFSFARIENHSNKLESFHVERGFSTQNTASIEFARGMENVDDSAGQYQNDDSLFFSSMTFAFTRAKASAKTSAPPGFSFPRMPPPGFSSQSRLDRMHESSSGSSISNSQQYHILGSSGDVQLIDPAILAVGQGRTPCENQREAVLQSCMAQPNTFENDRSRLLLQQDTNLQDHVITSFVGNIYVSSKDSYPSSQIISQTNSNLIHFSEISPPLNRHISNSHSDDWNDTQPINDVRVRNDLNVFENLRNGRFNLNGYLSQTEEHRFLYNRAFGM